MDATSSSEDVKAKIRKILEDEGVSEEIIVDILRMVYK